MTNIKTLLEEILRTTLLMKSGIEKKDIDLIEQMLKERKGLIDSYKELNNPELTVEEQAIVDKFMKIDSENNQKLAYVTSEMRKKIDGAKKEKSKVQLQNRVAKRYLTDGMSNKTYSRFNKKT